MYPECFDPTIREIIPANTNYGMLLNNTFIDYKETIETFLEIRNENKILNMIHNEFPNEKGNYRTYEIEKFREIYNKANEHIEKYNKEIKQESVITLVHPFYLQFSHMHKAKGREKKKKVKEYSNRLKRLFEDFPKDRFNLVIVDTLFHYMAGSSRLLEEGIVDSVILTEFDSGDLIKREKAKILHNKNLFFGGAYNEICLSTAIKEIKYARGQSKGYPSKGLRDLVIEHPESRKKMLDPVYVYKSPFGAFEHSDVLTTKRLFL